MAFRVLEASRLRALVDGLSLQTLSNRSIMPTDVIERIAAAHVDELARPA